MPVRKKVCLFVDGENFRNSLKEWASNALNPKGALLPSVKWTQLFRELASAAAQGYPGGDLVRVYWYVAGEIQSDPRLPDENAEDPILEEFWNRHAHSFGRALPTDKTKSEAAKQWIGELRRRFDTKKREFEEMQNSYSEIEENHDLIEFRRAGVLRIGYKNSEESGEKGVDVKLACDMLMLTDIYEIAAVLSGDQDFLPVVGAVKDVGRHVVVVGFKGNRSEVFPKISKRLERAADKVALVEVSQAIGQMGIPG